MKSLCKIAFFLCMFLISCSEDATSSSDTDTTAGDKIERFSVKTSNGEIAGKIDHESLTIQLPGVKYASSISDISYELGEGVSATTDPKEWIGSWQKEETFRVKDAQGKIYKYTVLMPDFERFNERPYVIGYIPDHGYERFSFIRWDLLTHVNLGFISVGSDGSISSTSVRSRLREVRETAHQHGVKVLVSMTIAYQAIESASIRNKAVDNLLAFVEEHELDGLDIDYELYDKIGTNLISFVQALSNKKDRKMLLTCAVAPWNPTTAGGYTKEWHKYFDIINIMAYDVHGGKEGQHSSFDAAINSINVWTKQLDAPAYKLTLGLPFYGYTWDEEAFPETYGEQVDYRLILRKYLKMYPEEKVWEKDQMGKTYYNGQETIKKKCQAAMQYGLGGVMIWQLFHDAYEEEYVQYSLMNAIEEGLKQ